MKNICNCGSLALSLAAIGITAYFYLTTIRLHETTIDLQYFHRSNETLVSIVNAKMNEESKMIDITVAYKNVGNQSSIILNNYILYYDSTKFGFNDPNVVYRYYELFETTDPIFLAPNEQAIVKIQTKYPIDNELSKNYFLDLFHSNTLTPRLIVSYIETHGQVSYDFIPFGSVRFTKSYDLVEYGFKNVFKKLEPKYIFIGDFKEM